MAAEGAPMLTAQQIRKYEQVPASPRLTVVNSPAPEPGDSGPRPLEVAVCSMCGVTHPLGLLIPDGSAACADIRWYCKDVKSCTERWTAALPQGPAASRGEVRPAVSATLSARRPRTGDRRPLAVPLTGA
jgi:hypothetical protein